MFYLISKCLGRNVGRISDDSYSCRMFRFYGISACSRQIWNRGRLTACNGNLSSLSVLQTTPKGD